MNFLAFLPLFNTLIEKIFPDPEKQAEAKIALANVANQAQAEKDKSEADIVASKGQVVTAEIKGESAAQRNWRPHLMYLFMMMIAWNYILTPILCVIIPSMHPLALPENMWSLMEICVGGYIVGRSGEKIVDSFNTSTFFNYMKNTKKGLTQEDTDNLNNAIKASESQG